MKRSQHDPVSSEQGNRAAAGVKKRVLVLYGSETGTAEGYAYETAARLRSFACSVSRFAISLLHDSVSQNYYIPFLFFSFKYSSRKFIELYYSY